MSIWLGSKTKVYFDHKCLQDESNKSDIYRFLLTAALHKNH